LTFANVFDSLYFYAPAVPRTTVWVGVSGVYGSSPFPSPAGDALVPFVNGGGFVCNQDCYQSGLKAYTYKRLNGTTSQTVSLNSFQVNVAPNLSSCSWKMADTGVQVRLAYARLTSDEATRLLEFCANKSLGLPTQNLISTQTTSSTAGTTAVNFTIDQPNIDLLCFTFPFSKTVLDFCPNPFLYNLEFKAQGRTLGGQAWDTTKPALLQTTGNALAEVETSGLNDELVSSYLNCVTLCQDADFTPNAMEWDLEKHGSLPGDGLDGVFRSGAQLLFHERIEF
jgi:hypothetical protein